MDLNHQHLSNGTKKEAVLEMESVKSGFKPLVVSILGAGEFGRALGRKIFETCSRSAVRVIFGSRSPSGEEIRFVGQDQPVETFSHEEAILKSGWFVLVLGELESAYNLQAMLKLQGACQTLPQLSPNKIVRFIACNF